MNIDLHIERLVVDGLNVGPGQGVLVKRAVQAELSRLLMEGGLADNLQSGGVLSNIGTKQMQIREDANPSRLGQEIARAVYGGIGQ